MRKAFGLLVFCWAFSLIAAAQANDLAVVAGAKITPSVSSTSGTTTVNDSLGIGVSFAHQVKGFSLAALQIEIAAVGEPNSTLKSSNFLASKSYNAIYITPGVRLRFLPEASASPWIALGGGIVRFSSSSVNEVGGTSVGSGSLKGTFDAGGGLDFKVPLTPLTLRAEVREYYSGVPNLNIPNLSLHNNIFAGGGLVLRF